VTPAEGFDTDHLALDAGLREFRSRAATRRQRRQRASLSTLLVFADLFMAAVVALNLHGAWRVPVGLAFCVVVPGWSIVGLLRLNNTPLEVGLSMAAGLCALTVLAQLAITFNLWHLTLLQLVVCAACLPSLLWQALERRWPPEAAR
jgi:uncharacterized membrane protein